MAFYFYLSTKIIMVFITKSYQDLFGVRSYINAFIFDYTNNPRLCHQTFQGAVPLSHISFSSVLSRRVSIGFQNPVWR